MACYEDLRQALAATAKERDEAVKRLREWEKFWADIALLGKMPPKKWEGRYG